MNSTRPFRRPTITLRLPRSVPALISYAQGIVKRMTANPSFPNPTPTLAAVMTAINDLQTAETDTLSRIKGAVALRDERRTALIAVLQHLRAYVQSISDGDPTNAASIIEGAGVAVRKTPTRRARAFTVTWGTVSGVAKVVAQGAARRAAYEWEYSTDGGKTWIMAPSTLRAKTTIAGLEPGVRVQFKYRAVTKAGEADWTQPLSLMMH